MKDVVLAQLAIMALLILGTLILLWAWPWVRPWLTRALGRWAALRRWAAEKPWRAPVLALAIGGGAVAILALLHATNPALTTKLVLVVIGIPLLVLGDHIKHVRAPD